MTESTLETISKAKIGLKLRF